MDSFSQPHVATIENINYDFVPVTELVFLNN